jgi:hypothetical protein
VVTAAKASEWRNAKHREQWDQTLREYAAPLRSMPVDEIDTTAILATLEPLWQTRPENRVAPARPDRSRLGRS